MTVQEAKKIMAVLSATYPQHYKNFDADMANNLITVWASIMAEYPYERVSTGLKRFIETDTKGFPPTPGQVIDKMPTKYELMFEEIAAFETHNYLPG